MEIEASTSAVAKKMWSIVRIMLMMMRKGVAKSKIMVELHLLLKRGKLAGKAMAESFILHYHHSSSAASAFGCRSDDAVSFVAPREYEFSCSNSPAAPSAAALYKPFHLLHKRNKHHHSRHYYGHDVSTTVTAVQKMLENMYYLNNNSNHNQEAAGAAAAAASEAYYSCSPMVAALPGFGRSPMAVRQLRITDSPFPIEGLGDSQVDVKAEDFINKFYKSLKAQNKTRSMSYLESPYREDVYG